MKEINDILYLEGQIKIPGGSPSANKALISDADGLATWETLTSSYVSDFVEAVDDRVNALLVEGPGITLTYDDGAGTLTIESTAGIGSFLNLTDTPSGYGGSNNYLIRVNSAATALEFVDGSTLFTLQDITDNGNTTTNQILVSGGSTTAPAFSFIGDTNTGIYRAADNIIGFTHNGTNEWQFSNTWMRFGMSGSVSAPMFAPDGDTNTGIYFPDTDQFAITTGGSQALLIDDAQDVYVKNTLFVGNLTPVLGYDLEVSGNAYFGNSIQVSDSLSITSFGAGIVSISGAMLFSSGSAFNPIISFSSDSNTGIYRNGSDSIGFSSGGSYSGAISSDGMKAENFHRESNSIFDDIVIVSKTFGSYPTGRTIDTVDLTGLKSKKRALIGIFPSTLSDAAIRRLIFNSDSAGGTTEMPLPLGVGDSQATPTLDDRWIPTWNGMSFRAGSFDRNDPTSGMNVGQFMLVFDDADLCTRPYTPLQETWGNSFPASSFTNYDVITYGDRTGSEPLFGFYYTTPTLKGGFARIYGSRVALETAWLSGNTPTLNLSIYNYESSGVSSSTTTKVVAFEQ